MQQCCRLMMSLTCVNTPKPLFWDGMSLFYTQCQFLWIQRDAIYLRFRLFSATLYSGDQGTRSFQYFTLLFGCAKASRMHLHCFVFWPCKKIKVLVSHNPI